MEGVTAGQLCMANTDREPSKPNELEYCKGDLVLILSDLLEDGLHYMASTADGTIGHFPSSDIQFRVPIPMLPMPWFHSSVSRLEAEKLLNRNQDGQFLLRTSQNTKAVYALAVSFKGSVMHYLVAMDFVTRKVTLNGEVYFNNLPELVAYYWKPSPHLCCPLRVPAVKRSTLEFYIDQEALRKSWGIDQSELSVANDQESLGQGEFGEVQVATYRGTQVAVKHIHSGKQSAAAVSSFLKEATIFTHLRHKNLVQLVGVVYQGSTIHSIVMELLGKGSLQKYLISRGRSVVSQAELLSFARDVCEGMVYISSKGYVHRDVAARNVLLNSNGQAKVSDFGLLRKADILVPHEGGKFPVKWTAPEALKESRFSIESDVWSFGVLLWEIYSYGRVPYPSIPADEVLGMLEDGIVMDPPDSCPDPMYNIMCRCWRLEPHDRPSFTTLREALAKSTAGSHTPLNSPLLLRRINAPMPDFKVDDLALSPTAEQSYQEAPHKRKVSLFIGNVVFVGPQSSGKTSLLKSLTGEAFKLTEPLSKSISIAENYHLIAASENWAESTAGLMYEDELVRIIVEDLLKHALKHPPVSNGSTPTPPALPPRRVQSFSHTHSSKLENSIKAGDRLSGSYETIDTPDLAENRSHSAADSEETRSPKLKSKHRLGRLGSRKAKAEIKRTYSDSVKREFKVEHTPEAMRPEYQSSIPEQLLEKIKSELRESSGCSLPARHFGRLIDTPGHHSFQQLKPLFITESSLCVLTFDVSKDIMTPTIQRKMSGGKQYNSMPSYYQPSGTKYSKDSYLSELMREIGDVCLQWSHSQSDMTLCGPRVLLVATHSDKVPSTISHRNFELLQDAIKASPYNKYVTLLKFIISNSSIIERTSTDDLRHYMMELIKKSCRQQIPLKWMRCIRRFRGFSKRGTYFLSLSEARKIISQICDISDEDEVSKVVHFLHQNLVILHFHRLHHLKELVITDPVWFSSKISQVFSASYIDLQAEGAPELLQDQETLRTTGVLSSPLLNFVWREKAEKLDELLSIMCKMDLCCCMGSGPRPLPVSSSVEDLTSDRPAHKSRSPNSCVSSVIIPGLVEDRKPTHLSTLPSYNIDPIVFKFKNSHVPSGLFSRLLVRCVQSYPRDYSIFRNGATFEVDTSTLLMISLESDHIKISLHKIRSSSVTESLPSSLDVTDLDSLLNDPNTPNPDLCLAVLMFVKATLTDLVQQWIPHVDFDLCVSCDCHAHLEEEPDTPDENRKLSTSSIRPRSPGERHYVILNDIDSVANSCVRCELGTMVTSISSLGCWFGESPNDAISSSSPTDHMDLITDSDLRVVVNVLGKSWVELGHSLGFTRKEVQRFSLSQDNSCQAGESMLRKWVTNNPKSASFFTLLGALEIVQRRDIADELVAARMEDEGISL